MIVNLSGFYLLTKYVNNNTIKTTIQNSTHNLVTAEMGNSKILNILYNFTATILEVFHYNSSASSLIKIYTKQLACFPPTAARISTSNKYFGIYNGSHIEVYNYIFTSNPFLSLITPLNRYFMFKFCGPWLFYSSTTGMIYQY